MTKLEKPKRHFIAKLLPPVETWMSLWGKIFEALDDENKEELTVIVHLALEMGSRQGQFTALEWKHVNFEKNEIIINQSLYEDKELGTTKKEKGHIVSITDSMSKELKRSQESQKEQIENREDKTTTLFLKRTILEVHTEIAPYIKLLNNIKKFSIYTCLENIKIILKFCEVGTKL